MKKTDDPCISRQRSSVRGRLSWVPPSLRLGFGWLNFVQVMHMQSQSVCVQVCNDPVMFIKYCFAMCLVLYGTLSRASI